MDPDTPDFNALRTLLAWKRHEQPPPGYFERFPDQVRARLLAQKTEALDPWWRRWFRMVESQPAFAGAAGLVVGALCFLGLSLADYRTQHTTGFTPGAREPWAYSVATALPPTPPELDTPTLKFAAEPARASSINPVISSGAPRGLFAPGAGLRLENLDRAGFSVRGAP